MLELCRWNLSSEHEVVKLYKLPRGQLSRRCRNAELHELRCWNNLFYSRRYRLHKMCCWYLYVHLWKFFHVFELSRWHVLRYRSPHLYELFKLYVSNDTRVNGMCELSCGHLCRNHRPIFLYKLLSGNVPSQCGTVLLPKVCAGNVPRVNRIDDMLEMHRRHIQCENRFLRMFKLHPWYIYWDRICNCMCGLCCRHFRCGNRIDCLCQLW